MRLFISFTILLFCSIQAFGQKVTPAKKTIGQKKIVQFHTKKDLNSLNSEDLYGTYNIIKYYSLVKKSAKKKEIEYFLNSNITIEKESISGSNISEVFYSIYEIENMKKDDFLFRVYNQVISTEIIELPETFKVHKTDLQNFFGIIQLLNGHVAFPYKGGLIIAKPSLSK